MTDPPNSEDFPSIPSPGDEAGPTQQWSAPSPTTQPPPPPPPTIAQRGPPPGYTAHVSFAATGDLGSESGRRGRWIGAVITALAIQIAAMIALVAGALAGLFGALQLAADYSSWIIWLAVPIGLLAPALWVFSGYVASKIARDGRGWLMLVIGPILLVIIAQVFVAVF